MILIADGGSTKTDWAVLDTATKEVIDRFSMPGFNPSHTSEEAMREFLTDELRAQLADLTRTLKNVYFYGAGCVGRGKELLDGILRDITETDNVFVESDIVGAALSLAGHEEAIVSILGTGSNSGHWNGHEFTEHVPPLGFILGDEGSGGSMGKRLLTSVLRRRLPDEICTALLDQYRLTEADIIHRVYGQPRPNAFLASFVPFLKVNIEVPEIRALVESEFDAFVKNNLLLYSKCHTLPCSFSGTVALVFADILSDVLEENGCQVGKIVRRPIQGLINYHFGE